MAGTRFYAGLTKVSMSILPETPRLNRREVRFLHQLATYLSESHEAFEDSHLELDCNWNFRYGQPLPDEELATWLAFLDEKIFQLNKATAKLIDDHRDLWDELPGPLVDFISYHSARLARHSGWPTDPAQSYSFQAELNFPQSINIWVLQELRDIMRSVAGAPPPMLEVSSEGRSYPKE